MKNKEVEAGRVYTLRGRRSVRIFVLTGPQSFEDMYEGKEFVEYLPVSSRTDLAMDTDFISVDGFMVDTETCSTVLVENIGKMCGTIEGQELEQLLNLFFYVNGMPYSKKALSCTPRGRNTGKEALRHKKRAFERSQKMAL